MSFSVNRLFNLIRGTLLAISLLAVVVALLWQYAPGSINRLDQWVVGRYTSSYEERLRRAEERIRKEPDKAVRKLERLLTDLAGVEKQDRLGRVKRRAFSYLVRVLEKQEAYPAALEWTRQWIDFDPRDLNALYREAMLLYRIPERREQGMAAMARLYRMMPEVKQVAIGYAELLHETGERGQATAVFETYSRESARQQTLSSTPVAEIFWDYGKGFSARTRPQVFPVAMDSGQSGLFFNAGPGAKRLRIDPVESLIEPRLFIWDGSGSQVYELARERLQFHEMSRVGRDRLGVEGEDPYLMWELPKAWSGKPLSLFLAVTVDERPAWMLRGVEEKVAAGNGMKRSLITAGSQAGAATQDVAAARAYALKVLDNYPLELFWRGRDEPFSEARKKRLSPRLEKQDGNTFVEAWFGMSTQASEVRIDFPPLPGYAYRLEGVRIHAKSGPLPAGTYPAETVRYNDLVARDGWLTATGADPYIVFRLPVEGLDISTVTFRSQVR